MREHPHAINVRAAFVAYQRGDFEAMSRRFADDIVWSVGGTHALSGDYQGRRDVIEHLRETQRRTGGSLDLTVEDVLASDRFAAVLLRAKAKRVDAEAELYVRVALALTFDDQGRWTSRFALSDDQHAVDDFWERSA